MKSSEIKAHEVQKTRFDEVNENIIWFQRVKVLIWLLKLEALDLIN